MLHEPNLRETEESTSSSDSQKRCSSLSAKAKVRVPILERPKADDSKIYLSPEQVLPLDEPEERWKKALEEIKCTTNWERQFEACNTFRSVCAHHAEILVCSPLQLHGLVLDLLKIIESLRSTLAKNGLLVLSGTDCGTKRE